MSAHPAPRPAPAGLRLTRATPDPPGGFGDVLARNIHALSERKRREEAGARLQDRIADAVTRFAGSMTFVYIHLALYGFWIVANLGWVPGVRPWDPTFVVLAMEASVEAIFLSTFVLISQNRMAAQQSKRADLDLQVSLLAEHEVTKLATLVAAIAAKLEVHSPVDRDMAEVERNVAPEAVLDEIEAAEAGRRASA